MKKRMIIGNRKQPKCHMHIENDVVIGVNEHGYRFALGITSDKLICWLLKKKIPHHSFGFKPRKTDKWIKL